jgi:hypothetical protein
MGFDLTVRTGEDLTAMAVLELHQVGRCPVRAEHLHHAPHTVMVTHLVPEKPQLVSHDGSHIPLLIHSAARRSAAGLRS